MANTTNHPPRQGVPIKPHKGGKTVRRYLLLTPELDKVLQEKAKALGLSLNETIAKAIESLQIAASE